MSEAGRILALDIGSKRTGVAVSDGRQVLASDLTTIHAATPEQVATAVAALVETEEAQCVLVGLPLNQNGEEGPDAVFVRRYIAALQKHLKVPVIEWDERFTTAQAERTLIAADFSRKKRKQVIDRVAATILLQSYLDHRHFAAPIR